MTGKTCHVKTQGSHNKATVRLLDRVEIQTRRVPVSYHRRRSMKTGSPSTMLVKCLNDPVRDMRSPPKDAYAVLVRSQ